MFYFISTLDVQVLYMFTLRIFMMLKMLYIYRTENGFVVIKLKYSSHRDHRRYQIKWKSRKGGTCKVYLDMMITANIDIERGTPRRHSFDCNHRRSYSSRNDRLGGRPWWNRCLSDHDRWNCFLDIQHSSVY